MSGALSVGILFRGVKNVYRSGLRTVALLVLLALSVGIFAGFRQATAAVASQSQQLTSVIGNTVEIRNAGASGMGAGAINVGKLNGGDAARPMGEHSRQCFLEAG